MNINKDTAEHYHWGNNWDGWHLVKQPQLSIIQETMPPHTCEVRHYHQHSRQFFYLLSGEATIEIAGLRYYLHPHEGIEVAPGTPHQIFNESQQNLEFLVTSQPPSHGDRVEV